MLHLSLGEPRECFTECHSLQLVMNWFSYMVSFCLFFASFVLLTTSQCLNTQQLVENIHLFHTMVRGSGKVSQP